MTSGNCKSEEKQVRKNLRGKPAATLERLMEEYDIQSEGKTLSGHFSPEEAIDVLETAASRRRSVSEVIKRATAIGLPQVKKQFQPIAGGYRDRPGQVHSVHRITPDLDKRMKQWKVLKEGKTLSGHFRPEKAIDLLETARTRGMSTGSIVKAAVRFGLPAVKKQIPPTRSPRELQSDGLDG